MLLEGSGWVVGDLAVPVAACSAGYGRPRFRLSDRSGGDGCGVGADDDGVCGFADLAMRWAKLG